MVGILFRVNKQRIELRPSLGLDNSITFGLEIEFELANRNDVAEEIEDFKKMGLLSKWQIVKEPSITFEYEKNSYGGEAVSPVFKDHSAVWHEIKFLCELLQNCGAVILDSAGGHIHYGSQIIGRDSKDWLNFLKLWMVYEKVIYRFAYGEKQKPRKSIEVYAPSISGNIHSILLDLNNIPENFIDLFATLKDKKNHAINFGHIKSPLCKFGNTIEIRCPNGSLDPIIWQSNIYFFAKLLTAVKNPRFDLELLQYRTTHYNPRDYVFSNYNTIDLHDAIELSNHIFDNEIDKYRFLKQYLKMHTQNELPDEKEPTIELSL